jgi:hypothetical protein
MNSDDLKQRLGIQDDGVYRVDSKTGIVQKEGLIGWADTGTRVDPESGRIEEQGLLWHTDTGRRIDPHTGEVQEQGIFGYKDGDTRIAPGTGKIQKRGLFGWKDTGERIDPKNGTLQEEGLLGWRDSTSRKKRDLPSRSPGGQDPHALDSPPAAEPEGLIWSLASGLSRFLVPLGALVGLIAGVQWAYEHSYGFQGYVGSALVGAVAGSIFGSIAGIVLALSAVAFVLVWILRACGAPI